MLERNAFRRQHGVAPSEAKRYVGKLKLYEHLTIQVILKGAEPMQYNVIEKENFRVIGLKREYIMANGENFAGTPRFWDEVSFCAVSSETN